MTAKPTLTPDEPYSRQNLEKIAGALGVSSLSVEATNELQAAAFRYSVMSLTEPKKGKPKAPISWPKKADQRKALKSVAEAARKLEEALGNPTLWALDDELRPTIDKQQFERLYKAVEMALPMIPSTAAVAGVARLQFVEVLGEMYVKATGKRPTLSRDRHGKPGGGFYRFAETAIHPLNPHATQGLESDVRKVVRALKNSTPKSR